MIKRVLAGLLAVAMVTPIPALAQDSNRAGIVTVLEGNVTARRQPQPVALKFKDEVRLLDTVVTEEKSLARMLLGGKAVVTVRERSSMTITKVPPTDIITARESTSGRRRRRSASAARSWSPRSSHRALQAAP
jgi:hypothetical protein